MEKLFKQADAIIVTSPSNLFYFSGLKNHDARIILTPREKYYLTDKRSIDEAKELLDDFVAIDTKSNGLNAAAIEILKELKIKSAGYEDDRILHKDYIAFQTDFEMTPVNKEINALRSVKSDREIALIEKAQEVTDSIFNEILEFITPGMPELRVAAKINAMILENGCENAFDTIVAFGKNTARPHCTPSNLKLEKNDVILLDYGAKYNGYCSDMTRSFAIGRPLDGYRETYFEVLSAQEKALKGIRAGLSGYECHKLASDCFEAKNLNQYFCHALGHSLGVDIHESPSLSPRVTEAIPCGAVVSVEPGLYFDEKYGVRIEDIVQIKNNGVYNLTKSAKQLIIL